MLPQALQLPCAYKAVSLLKSEASLCLVQDLSEDELGKVFKSGLHLPEWAALRLVSKRWKALANSCADCVNLDWTGAEWQELSMRMKKCDCQGVHICHAKATVSRLCYLL